MQRWDIINKFITDRNYKSFLEIGTASGECFNHVIAEEKVSVDPNEQTNATYKVTSDKYFANKKYHKNQSFDIIFIDGLHEAEQAYRDIQNALNHLNRGGVIVIHDCAPTSKQMQEPYTNQHFWTGDVWKAFVKARAELPYDMYVVKQDFGCGIIDTTQKKKQNTDDLPSDIGKMAYEEYVLHPEWMNFREEM